VLELKAIPMIAIGVAAILLAKPMGRAAARQNASLWRIKTKDWWYICAYTVAGVVFVAAGALVLLGVVPMK
jgi:hypothetical protein